MVEETKGASNRALSGEDSAGAAGSIRKKRNRWSSPMLPSPEERDRKRADTGADAEIRSTTITTAHTPIHAEKSVSAAATSVDEEAKRKRREKLKAWQEAQQAKNQAIPSEPATTVSPSVSLSSCKSSSAKSESTTAVLIARNEDEEIPLKADAAASVAAKSAIINAAMSAPMGPPSTTLAAARKKRNRFSLLSSTPAVASTPGGAGETGSVPTSSSTADAVATTSDSAAAASTNRRKGSGLGGVGAVSTFRSAFEEEEDDDDHKVIAGMDKTATHAGPGKDRIQIGRPTSFQPLPVSGLGTQTFGVGGEIRRGEGGGGEGGEDDVDPLDAYMTDLYGAGDVATQRAAAANAAAAGVAGVSSAAVGSSGRVGAPGTGSRLGGRAAADDEDAENEDNGYDEDEEEEEDDDDDDDDDDDIDFDGEDFEGGLGSKRRRRATRGGFFGRGAGDRGNGGGSNFITLEEILAQQSGANQQSELNDQKNDPEGEGNSSSSNALLLGANGNLSYGASLDAAGWESDFSVVAASDTGAGAHASPAAAATAAGGENISSAAGKKHTSVAQKLQMLKGKMSAGDRDDDDDEDEEDDEVRLSTTTGVSAGGSRRRRKETEEEREEREEREKQEFIAAIRKSREEEEELRKKLMEVDAEVAAAAAAAGGGGVGRVGRMGGSKGKIGSGGGGTTGAEKEQELGRVFAGEGDVVEEHEMGKAQRSALEILEEAKRGKELKAIDHSKVDYMPFRKNLYIVPRALSKLSEEEVKEKREDIQVKVRGKGCPAPVDSWEQCGLSDRILDTCRKYDLKEPFAIQQQAIPAIMCGRDVIGVAKTGSGKTLAFLLPMLRHILDQPPIQDNEGPVGLIMAPARELAFQIYNEAKKFCKPLNMRVACVYGGAGVADQIADLKRGSDIVVCTPGRMIDILCMQAGKLISLKRVSMVVLDEADRMFDMGFEPQIRMILQNIRPDRQTVLFSATFPKQIEKLARTVLQFPLEITVGERSSVNKDITQFVEVHEEEDKFLRLLQLLGVWYERGSVLIFVDKQEKCDQLFQELLRLGYPCLSLHGGKEQIDREHTLHEFKTGIKTVMIATSVAGRGLDVPEIRCVINYNCPNHMEDYVHRVGRTGRAGKKGTAYTFLSSKEEQYAPIMVKALEKAAAAAKASRKAVETGKADDDSIDKDKKTTGGKYVHPEQPLVVPPELIELSNGFKAKVERGEAQWSSSGFVGKGYTFDSSEMNETQKVASMQRKAYEVEQGLVDLSKTAAEGDMDDAEDADIGVTPSSSSSRPFQPAPPAAAATAATALLPALPPPLVLTDDMTPLEKAKAMAEHMKAVKAAEAARAVAAAAVPPVVALGGIVATLPSTGAGAGAGVNPSTAMAQAALIAQRFSTGGSYTTPNMMLGMVGALGNIGSGGVSGYSSSSVAARVAPGMLWEEDGHFFVELEINDYPAQARKRATNRTSMDQIKERASVGVVSRGVFVKEGQKVPEGERKLHLLIQGDSEMGVKQAKLEFMRILEEETMRLGASGALLSAGRYSVI